MIDLSVHWYSCAMVIPPKNQWVLMVHGIYTSLGRWNGQYYEFFDVYVDMICSIEKPSLWAYLPNGNKN